VGVELDRIEPELRKKCLDRVPPRTETIHLVGTDLQSGFSTVVPNPEIAADAETPKICLTLLDLTEALGGDLQAIHDPAGQTGCGGGIPNR
jgi:hypothetical protein